MPISNGERNSRKDSFFSNLETFPLVTTFAQTEIQAPHLTDAVIKTILSPEKYSTLHTLKPLELQKELNLGFIRHYLLTKYNLRVLEPGKYHLNHHTFVINDAGSVRIFDITDECMYTVDLLVHNPIDNRLTFIQVLPQNDFSEGISIEQKVELQNMIHLLYQLVVNCEPKLVAGIQYVGKRRKNKVVETRHKYGMTRLAFSSTPYMINTVTAVLNDYKQRRQKEKDTLPYFSYDDTSATILNLLSHLEQTPDSRTAFPSLDPSEPLASLCDNELTTDTFLEIIDNKTAEYLKQESLSKLRGTISEILANHSLLEQYELTKQFPSAGRFTIADRNVVITPTGSIELYEGPGISLFEIDGLLYDPIRNKFLILEAKAGSNSNFHFNSKKMSHITWLLQQVRPSVPVSNYEILHITPARIVSSNHTVFANNIVYQPKRVQLPYSISGITTLAYMLQHYFKTNSKLQ